MDLIIENITKIYRSNGTPKTVLNSVSLAISGGQFVTLLGPSGCGKTTLLNIVAGFQRATSGRVILNGRAVEKPGPDRVVVFQDYALFPWMTVKQNILFPMKQRKLSGRDQEGRLKGLLEMTKLEGLENLLPGQLSGGQKQRTAVARALACDPELFLMDEPLGAVDYQTRQALQEELEGLWLRNRTTVFMVTHDVEEAIYLSDRVIVMSSREGAVLGDIPINLPRPRHREEEGYRGYKNQITGLLKNSRNP